MSAAVVGLVVALPEESRSLTNRRVRIGEYFAVGKARRICIAGIGAENARRAAYRLIEEGARGLVSWGCAASVSPDLGPGALCLPEEVLDARGERQPAWPAWHKRAQDTLAQFSSPSTGLLLSVEHMLATVADKKAVAARFHAVAIDMESAAVAAVACERNVPFLAVRAIADPLDMVLPAAVLHATDANGTVHVSRLIRHTLLNPREVPGLLRLAAHFRSALRTLTTAAHRMGDDLLLGCASSV